MADIANAIEGDDVDATGKAYDDLSSAIAAERPCKDQPRDKSDSEPATNMQGPT